MVTCYGRTVLPGQIQEVYETASKDAGRRKAELKRLGIAAYCWPMGMQITSIGLVNLTMLNIYGDAPAPERIVRL